MKHFELVKTLRLKAVGVTLSRVEREWRHVKTGIILVERIDHNQYNTRSGVSLTWTWHKWTDRSRKGFATLKYWVRKYHLGDNNVQTSKND